MRLHPEPSDLDLVVGAADEYEVSVPGLPHQVAGAVHQGARGVRVRIGHEALCGCHRAGQVALGHGGTADVQLADASAGNRIQPLVQHVQSAFTAGGSQGDLLVLRHSGRDPEQGRGDDGLGGAIGVEQRHLGQDVLPVGHGGGGHALAARDHQSQSPTGRDLAVAHRQGERVPVAARQVGDRHRVALDEFGQLTEGQQTGPARHHRGAD